MVVNCRAFAWRLSEGTVTMTTTRKMAGRRNDANKAKGRLISWWQSDHDKVCLQMGRHCPSHDQVTVTRERKKEGSGIYHWETQRGRSWLPRQLGRKEWKNGASPQQQKIASSQATRDCCYRNKENRDPIDHGENYHGNAEQERLLNQNGAHGPKQIRRSEKNIAPFPFVLILPVLPKENRDIFLKYL